ncbi:MAG: hypothetical protein NTU79_07815 [Planctomycetota bacterium]|nr:hypothetical protein [Planctomycetota bacterium]
MIARRDECNPDLLAELLHARLTQADELSITTHLDGCADCRRKLDQLTAPDDWWIDTQRTLKDKPHLGTTTSLGATSLGARHRKQALIRKCLT